MSQTALRFVFAVLFCLGLAASASAGVRILHDQGHGQAPVPAPMGPIAERLGLEVVASEQPITPALLSDVAVLYLRAPSQPFSAAEKDAIVSFVKQGGSLFLVLDEERRQSLAGTGVNDLIVPFGLELTPDYPAPHNTGAIAPAGEIHRADREVPYSGGRAVKGGTPFSFVLDEAGKPAAAHGAYAKLDSGARIVVLGDGMVTIFLGRPDGQRLQGSTPQDSRYWGKDSAVFMEEVLRWLAKL